MCCIAFIPLSLSFNFCLRNLVREVFKCIKDRTKRLSWLDGHADGVCHPVHELSFFFLVYGVDSHRMSTSISLHVLCCYSSCIHTIPQVSWRTNLFPIRIQKQRSFSGHHLTPIRSDIEMVIRCQNPLLSHLKIIVLYAKGFVSNHSTPGIVCTLCWMEECASYIICCLCSVYTRM